jgi:hypothetical protein
MTLLTHGGVSESPIARLAAAAPLQYVTDDTTSRVGKPGAWRNRSNRCEHGVERDVMRCWSCEIRRSRMDNNTTLRKRKSSNEA